jgi:hypothetical protein
MTEVDPTVRAASAFRPVKVNDVELTAPIAALTREGHDRGLPHGSALSIVRLHSP